MYFIEDISRVFSLQLVPVQNVSYIGMMEQDFLNKMYKKMAT